MAASASGDNVTCSNDAMSNVAEGMRIVVPATITIQIRSWPHSNQPGSIEPEYQLALKAMAAPNTMCYAADADLGNSVMLSMPGWKYQHNALTISRRNWSALQRHQAAGTQACAQTETQLLLPYLQLSLHHAVCYDKRRHGCTAVHRRSGHLTPLCCAAACKTATLLLLHC
jgi:hypothetical protein